jgi:hypothetical protein
MIAVPLELPGVRAEDFADGLRDSVLGDVNTLI